MSQPINALNHLGDGSPKALVNLGDVVLINTGDGVFTRREPHTSHRNQMKLINAIAAAAVIGASFMTATPAEAFWGGKVAEQRKMILGTWDCTYETGGKTYRPEMNQFSFRRDGGLKTDLRMGTRQIQMMGSWKINKESELIFPAGGRSEMKDLRTRTTKVEAIDGTMYNEILTLSSSRLIFEREGGGEVYSCRK